MIQSKVLGLTAIADRLPHGVHSESDLRIEGGTERVTIESDPDPLTGRLTPRDGRITLNGPWVRYDTNFGDAGYFWGFARNNPELPSHAAPCFVQTTVPGSTVTIRWRGTVLSLVTLWHPNRGVFEYSTDGEDPTEADLGGAALTSYGYVLGISTREYGDHETTITVKGTKNAFANDFLVAIGGFEITTTYDSSVRYVPGKAYPGGRLAEVETAGSLSIQPLSGSSEHGRQDLVVLMPGATAPTVIQGEPTAGGTYATFLENNERSLARVSAGDTTGDYFHAWVTRRTSAPTWVRLGHTGDNSDSNTTNTDFMEVIFVGTGLAVEFGTGPDMGYVEYSVDGVVKGSIDLYAAVNGVVLAGIGYNLHYGTHKVKLRKMGTKNALSNYYIVDIRAFFTYRPKAPALPEGAVRLARVFPTPATGWVKSPANTRMLYLGSGWAYYDDPSITGGRKSVNTNLNATDYCNFKFTGSGFQIWAKRQTDTGIFRVIVNGIDNGTVDTYKAAPNDISPVFTYSGPDYGYYDVTIMATNTKNASSTGKQFTIDSIDILPCAVQVIDDRQVYPQDDMQMVRALIDHSRRHHRGHPVASTDLGFPTVTSTTFVPLGNTCTPNCTGRRMLFLFSGQVKNSLSTGSTSVRLMMDDVVLTDAAEPTYNTYIANEEIPITAWAVVTPTAGPHNFQVSAKVTSGTGTVYGGLLVIEL
jgi:hypothetical protein